MSPNHTNIHPKFKLNGFHYRGSDLKELAYCYIKEGAIYEQYLGRFILDWLDTNDVVVVKTSGSTGAPKLIEIKKEAMIQSALATGVFFKLKPNDRALHCLPSNYIAGKMMLVRAFVLGLDLMLIEPKARPLIHPDDRFDFCALTPMQLQNIIKISPNFKTIIVGGGQVSQPLTEAIQQIRPKVYETYGMTETVSHVALKQLNKQDQSTPLTFKTLPNITLFQDQRGCLVIRAPFVSSEDIVTNDLITLYSKSEFEWLGRYDNVINSGGIKLYPEQIERKLQSKLNQRFFITSKSDDLLGDKVVMMVEGQKNNFDFGVLDALEPYEKPKEVLFVSKFNETKTGKIKRQITPNKSC